MIRLSAVPGSDSGLRHQLCRVLLLCVVTSVPVVSVTYGDTTFMVTTSKMDSSTPPAGTEFVGGIVGCIACDLGPAPFPGMATLTLPGPPADEPREVELRGGVRTPYSYIDQGDVRTGYWGYYNSAAETVTCADTCVFSTKHWARYGSVAGSVLLKNGAPLRDYTVVASDPEASPVVSYSKAVNTDAFGRYSFSSTTGRIYSFQFPSGMIDFPIPESNNWGLWVYQHAEDTAPTKLYNILAGRQSAPVEVTSSTLSIVDFVLTLEEAEEDPPYKRCEGSGGGGSCLEDESLTGICPGKPVSVLTGNMFLDQTDVTVGGTAPLVLTRSYNSVDAYKAKSGWFGRGWSSTYERTLREVHPGVVAITKENGNTVYFTDLAGNGTFEPYSAASGRGSVTRSGSSYVRTLLDGSRETYGSDGKLVTLTDAVGNVTALERDAYGRVTAAVAASGRRLTFVYSGGSPLVRALLGPASRVATYEYDGTERLIRTTYADGSGYEYAYDAQHQLVEMRDLSGRVLESHAYVGGKAVTSETADGVEKFTFSYEPTRTTMTDALGNVTQFDIAQIDEQKVITRVAGPCPVCGASGGQTQEWTHDARGRVTSRKNGLGETWQYTYDAAGNRDSVTDPLDRTTRYTFDGRGRVLTTTPPGGEITTYTYVDAGLATATDPLNHTLTVGYDVAGNVASVTDVRGKTTSVGRNTAGDATSSTDPLGHTTTFDVDASGWLVGVTSPLGQRTTFTRDGVGRIVGVREPTGAEWAIAYDKGGRRTSVTDPQNRSTRYVYDAYGRLASVVDTVNGATSFSYDALSNLTALTDAKSHTTRFEYDGYQRLSRTTYPDGRFETYTYDGAGRLLTKTDRRAVVTTYAYDALGRLTGKSYSDGSPAVAYGYDARDRLASAANGVDTLTWAYDEADRLVSETSTRNGSTVSYTRDAAGLRLSLGLDGVEWLTYGWDDASRPISIMRGTQTFGFGYDADDGRVMLSHPNGIVTTYSYDVASRLTGILASAGATTLEQVTYAYDVLSNRTRKTTQQFSESYGYDGLDRLLSVERTGSVSGRWHFGYDAVGNRTSSQAGDAVLTATYDEANRFRSTAGGGNLVVQGQLDEPGTVTVNGQAARMLAGNVFEATVASTSGANAFTVVARDLTGHERTSTYQVDVPAAAATLSYDANGNLIGSTDGGHTWAYEWTVENELARVLKDGAEVARFSYDALGRRVEKVAGSTTMRYTYDGVDIVREVVDSSTTTTTYRYVHGPGIDEPLARENAATGASLYYHADGLGSIVRLTDGAGTTVKTYRHDAWGNIESEAGPLNVDGVAYAFTGREWDKESELYYYRARYYDPKVGRFISKDPIGFAGGVNFYSYVENRPGILVDPLGMSPTSDSLKNAVGLLLLFAGANKSPFADGSAPFERYIDEAIASVTDEQRLALLAGGVADPETLSRLGLSRESLSRLARKAAEAEQQIGIHGVSCTAGEPRGPASKALRAVVEELFGVVNTPTRSDPLHRTIELPKPVTDRVAQLFNQVFGRK